MPPEVSFTIDINRTLSYKSGYSVVTYRTITYGCHVNWAIFGVTFRGFYPQVYVQDPNRYAKITDYNKFESIDDHFIPQRNKNKLK